MKGLPLKIVLSINTSWNIFNFRMNLIHFLQQEGYEIVVIAPEDNYSPKIVAKGIKFYSIKMQNKGTNPFCDLSLINQYKEIFSIEKPNLILLYTIKPNIYGTIAAHRLGIPVINNVTGLGTAFIRKNWVSWVAQRLYKYSFSKSSVVFFQNTDDRALFKAASLVSSNKTRLIPGSGIDTVRFSPKPLPKKRVVLFIGRLLYDKGIVELLHAAEIIRRRFPDLIEIRILGKFETEANLGVSRELIELYNDSGVITYRGTTDRVEDEIEKASAVILPSYREGTSRSLLEAAAMGRPLLASDVPGCNNIVRDSVNGWLFQPKSIEGLVDVLAQLISVSDQELEEKGIESRTIVENEFGESLVFYAYLKEIKSILSSS